MTDKSVLHIATELVDSWPYSTGVKSAHKSMLIAMIAEKLSEQWKAGYKAGMMRATSICEQQDRDGEGPDCWGWHPKDYAKAIRAEAEKKTT